MIFWLSDGAQCVCLK